MLGSLLLVDFMKICVCVFGDFRSGEADDSVRLGHDAVSLDNPFQTFRRNEPPSASRISILGLTDPGNGNRRSFKFRDPISSRRRVIFQYSGILKVADF